MSRNIFYSEHDQTFTEGFGDEGIITIPNIYREINPNFIYLLFANKDPLKIHDLKGVDTELMILPF